MADTELNEWRDLVQSPGWGRLVAHAEAMWSGTTLRRALEDLADKPDAESLSKLRQLLAASKAVAQVLAVPREAIARLDRNEPVDGVPGRRGGL